MGNKNLQEKIDYLQRMADSLLFTNCSRNNLYSDELAALNHSIHQQIDELYPLRGKTVEQDASLCLAILMGYSVSMYANPDDERKKQTVLKRSQKLLESLSPCLLKEQLRDIYSRLSVSF